MGRLSLFELDRELAQRTDKVAHLIAFHFKVFLAREFGRHFCADTFGHRDAVALHGIHLFRVVRNQADGTDAELIQDLGGQREVTMVSTIAEFNIGLDRVSACVLQFVGTELGHQTNAASFLCFIENDAGTMRGDGVQCEFQLLAAVASKRMEDVSSEAL